LKDKAMNRSMKETAGHGFWLLLVLLCLSLLAGCLEDLSESFRESQSSAAEQSREAFACSVRGQNRRVHQLMQDWYLYVDRMPDIDPDDFPGPNDVLDALQVNPDTFSALSDRETRERFTEAGERLGIGIQLRLLAEPDDYRIVDVYEGSPAHEAGMARGDRLLTINERSIEDWFLSGELPQAFGPDEEGVVVSLEAERPDGSVYERTLEKEIFAINPLSDPRYFELDDGQQVAYIHLRSFNLPAEDRMRSVFNGMDQEGVDRLILDMRYNGGGRLSVAETLASRIAGDELAGDIFVALQHNEARSDMDGAREFQAGLTALDLDQLTVIGTDRTASASELIINGLQPFMDVDLIGDRTFGKPVGSYSFTVCDLLLAPTTFSMVNAQGQGDYFDGLPTTCDAPDGLNHALGDPDESSLAQALHFLQTGECDSQSLFSARKKRAIQHPAQIGGPEGWDPHTMGIR